VASAFNYLERGFYRFHGSRGFPATS